ncbi:hypothetical protein [Chryseobacterium gambrini]|uniref:hypothetical protein n=1 Tax=Chryseobacterium gambrini TaxID=373672 RepID=UPI0022F1D3DD|nr:hypothetical protein [Chryseobacterium gambrini]WBV53671.1 hypothetical protein PFY09_04975 [Chryseobacterium gambrini]
MARIYQTASSGEAQVRVAVVNSRDEADLLVHRVSSWGWLMVMYFGISRVINRMLLVLFLSFL